MHLKKSIRSLLTLIFISLTYSGTYLFAFQSTLDVLHYEVSLEPDIPTESVRGSVTIGFNLPPDEHTIELNSGSLTIDSVKGIFVQQFSHTGDELLIRLSEDRDNENELTIQYHGNPPKGLHFIPEKNQAYTVYFTEYWMVLNPDPGDKATITMNILVDKELDCIASGALISVQEKEGKHVYKWEQNFDSPAYTFGFAIGSFKQQVMKLDKVTIRNYGFGYSSDELKQIFIETPDMISFFEEKTGIEYFNSTYSQILIGNHYQEMSGFSVLRASYGSLVLADSTETNLISHELAHQWWGNRITCAGWEHFWLNEAFATFMSAAYNEHRFGRDKYVSDIDAYYAVYKDIKDRNNDKSLVFENWINPSKDDRNLVYFKGAYVLHLLREELGDEVFWAGIRYYSRKYFDQTVTTSDFHHAMETVSDRDLNSFFDEWVY
ncbi:MAG TPA: hypothetical protein DEQ34_07310 [Balneolaceae bacterium]|nr:hypothetical protein [Balneolaceae bacterium]|tara:strand:+ start:24610 stop:25914 length:1305 start_codon:yes stop_codon:yes gene_type:complete